MTTQPDAPASSLPPHRKVRVDLGPRSYDVVIGKGLLDKSADWATAVGIKGQVAIISDSTVSGLYAERVKSLLNNAGLQTVLITVPAGESSKSMANVSYLLSKLAEHRLPRSGTIIGIGGGVIGDLAGYVAASYLRGVAFVQVPTTLLAMVDSSVGGKTGVNLPEGKNLVGAFYQPKLVVADLDTLKSLVSDSGAPNSGLREFPAGLAEVIKYGAIADSELFERVAQGVKPDAPDLDEIIEKCVTIKARIVEQDEFEEKGLRALLNFGHTIGHAIEGATEYKQYLHGEAVAIGMRAAAWLSHFHDKTKLPIKAVQDIEAALKANYLPVQLRPDIAPGRPLTSAQIFSFLGRDKKTKDGYFRWVLLKSIGEAQSDYIFSSTNQAVIDHVLLHLFEPSEVILTLPNLN